MASERDVVRELHAHGASTLARPVSAVMRTVVATCTKVDSADDVRVLMTEHRIRHVPVLDDGRLAGIVSIGDVVKSRIEELQAEHEQLPT